MNREARRARMAEIVARIETLSQYAEMTRSQQTEYRSLRDEFNALEAQNDAEDDADRDRLRAAATGTGTHRLDSAIPGAPSHTSRRQRAGAGMDEYRGRALDTLDRVESQPGAIRSGLDTFAALLAGPDGDDIARHVDILGDPAYLSAFLRFSADPETGYQSFDEDERRAWSRARQYATRSSLTTTGVGTMIPLAIETQILASNTGTLNPNLRDAFTVKTITTTTWQGNVSLGVNAEWAAENAQAADASPTVSGFQITTHRADAFVTASYESIMDAPSLASEVSKMIVDAKARLEATAFVKGTGSGQPKGIVPAAVAASKTVGTASADTFVLGDVYAVKAATPPRFRGNGSWLLHDLNVDKIRRMSETLTGEANALVTSLAEGIPSRLLGLPLYLTSELDSPGANAGAGNDALGVFGDLRAYTVVDRVGLMVKYIPDVMGANGRPLGQSGWFGFWRTGADLVIPDAVRVLQS